MMSQKRSQLKSKNKEVIQMTTPAHLVQLDSLKNHLTRWQNLALTQL
jgi:hypothetical protein